MKFYSAIDMLKNAIKSLVIDPLAGAPSSPVAGQLYFDTTLDRLQIRNAANTAWGFTVDNALALNGQNAAFYLARGNHTGTQTAATISDLAATVQAYRLDQFAVPTADLNFNSRKITNVADPVSTQDAATKGYVDVKVQQSSAGIDSKPSVRAVANTNITLSGTQTIDGVAVIAGDRVLVRGQSTGSENGPYVVAAGAWSRAVDGDETGELTPGATWYVEEGTSFGKSTWRIENTGAITVGTTSITINQFTGAASYTASLGVQLVGNDFRAQAVAAGGISAVAGGLQVDRAYVPNRYATDIGNGVLTSSVVTHNLNTKDVAVSVRQNSNDEHVLCDIVSTSVNSITLTFGSAPAASALRVTVIG